MSELKSGVEIAIVDLVGTGERRIPAKIFGKANATRERRCIWTIYRGFQKPQVIKLIRAECFGIIAQAVLAGIQEAWKIGGVPGIIVDFYTDIFAAIQRHIAA